MNNRIDIDRVARQHGAALLTGLIFLVVLTLIGVAAARMASLEERMSGNMRDRSLAFQMGETALRYAEQQIQSGSLVLDNFDDVCTGGLCYYGLAGTPGVVAWEAYCTPDCPIQYVPGATFGSYSAPPLPNGVPAPSYLVELFRKKDPANGILRPYYRITVRATGAKPGTMVWLQEVYRPL